MKIVLLPLLFLTGCASVDKAVCTGTGTCTAQGTLRATDSRTYLPQTVITSQGTVLIIRDASTGRINSLLTVTGTK